MSPEENCNNPAEKISKWGRAVQRQLGNSIAPNSESKQEGGEHPNKPGTISALQNLQNTYIVEESRPNMSASLPGTETFALAECKHIATRYREGNARRETHDDEIQTMILDINPKKHNCRNRGWEPDSPRSQ
jgi:hypothetical protein